MDDLQDPFKILLEGPFTRLFALIYRYPTHLPLSHSFPDKYYRGYFTEHSAKGYLAGGGVGCRVYVRRLTGDSSMGAKK